MKSYYDESQPMQLGIGRQGEGMKGNGWRLIPPNIIHATELPDDRYITVRARIWLDRGTVPYLSWIDGPPKGTRGNFISTKLYKYDRSVPKIERHVWENLALRAERDKLYRHLYQGPEVRVHYWQVTGPMRDDKPHPARTLLFAKIAPDEKQIEPERLQTELQALASRLFRHEVTGEDIAPYASAVQSVSMARRATPTPRALYLKRYFVPRSFCFSPSFRTKTIRQGDNQTIRSSDGEINEQWRATPSPHLPIPLSHCLLIRSPPASPTSSQQVRLMTNCARLRPKVLSILKPSAAKPTA
jgi:hypothetical protein